MTIEYIPEGDLFKANQLWGEGRHQLSILKNLMSFGKLQQDQRTVRFADGTIIKCLSCFGQDIINIFVPQVFLGGAPEYRERTIINYYPAFDAHDEDNKYVGVVLCKGGGFNPPYEFVEKDYLPTDYIYEPPEPYYDERNWTDLGEDGEIKYKDIIPSGIAEASCVQSDQSDTGNRGGGYVDLVTSCEREWDLGGWCPPHWQYAARTYPRYVYNEVSSVKLIYGLTFSPAPFIYTPLNVTQNFYNEASNNFNWNFLGKSSGNLVSTEIVQDAVKKVQIGEVMGLPIYECVVDDEGVTSVTARAAAEATIIWAKVYEIETDYSTGAETPTFQTGLSSNSHTNTTYKPYSTASGSVMDDSHYAVVYSIYDEIYKKQYHSPENNLEDCIDLMHVDYTPPDVCYDVESIVDLETTTIYEGPLEVVVNSVTFVVAARAEQAVSPRLKDSNVKYFKMNATSIGMFYIKKNYSAPYDHWYVYVSVAGEDNQEMITTVVDWIGTRHIIPGVKMKKDGEEFDLYGFGSFRLIRKEITVKEMATADQPGLFKKI